MRWIEPDVKRKNKLIIENSNENIRLRPGTEGVLLTSEETKIPFTIIKIEKNTKFLNKEPNKIFWINYPKTQNARDKYIAINHKNLTYSHSIHFGDGKIQFNTSLENQKPKYNAKKKSMTILNDSILLTDI